MSDWLTVKQAAELLDYHPNHVRLMLRKGHILGRKQRNGYWAISKREALRVQSLQNERADICTGGSRK
jgi:hypothetical protein